MGKKSTKRSPKKATSKRSPSQSKKPATKKGPAKASEPDDVIYGKAAAAKRWGRSDRTIQTWIQNGMPVSQSGRKYVFDLSVCDPWVESYLSDNETSDSKKLNDQLKREKLKQEILKTEDLERKKQIDKGKLVSREEFDLFAAECVIEARDQFLTVPKEMRRHLCKKCQTKVVELQKLIEQTLQRLSVIEEGPNKE